MSKPRYHQSAIQTYLKCGKMYDFRYIQGLKTPPKAALTVGSSVDAAVTYNFVEKIKTGQDLPTEAVLDTFSTDFDTRAKETEWGEDDAGKQKDMGAQLVKIHCEQAAPTIKPETVQESFVIETDAGYDLGGTIDLIETSGIVADTKTSKGAYDDDAVFRAIQPALYDFAYEALRGKPSTGFRYDVLVKPTARKAPEYKPISAVVTQRDREWLFETISQVHKAISAGVALPPMEGSWACSDKWCGFWNLCKGKK